MVAFRVVQALLREPHLRVLYLSSTANLAEKQLGFIKRILEGSTVRRYWPLHVNKEEGKRSKWTSSEIELDHPIRRQENIRDPSIRAAGLTTSLTGMHFDIVVLDDVVVQENAYIEEGRVKVRTQYSLISSIEGTDSYQWVVGTRYHPKDLYNDMMEMTMEIYDRDGMKISDESVYEVLERKVEDVGDGSGNFLWPRQQRQDGKWFGFNQQILARKKAQYLDRMQFQAQYYNNPDDPDNRPVDYNDFQYFEVQRLRRDGGVWFYGSRKLNLVASIDFAYSLSSRADWTTIVVVGTDADNNHYVLDLERFKTGDVSEYFKRILGLYNKWGFRRLIAESNAAQATIIKTLRSEYILRHSIPIWITEVTRTKHEGTKTERVNATLIPLYKENKIYHFSSGSIQFLEEELVTSNPAHDDCKDVLATAIEHAAKPSHQKATKEAAVTYHPRFGGRL